jgi:hypothetical protein
MYEGSTGCQNSLAGRFFAKEITRASCNFCQFARVNQLQTIEHGTKRESHFYGQPRLFIELRMPEPLRSKE